ncbi:MAG: DUF1573 domain-containing protein [Crocinitomicaceae bacterium]
MSRLYLAIIFIGFSSALLGQNNLKKHLEFAQEQFDKGDYFYAMEYYEKAMELDSNSVDILWKYAETARAYKDYRKAEFYYAKVYGREEARIYPESLLNLGLMQKQNAKYNIALETFKRVKKKSYKNKKSYNYQKAKKEIESTVWAKSAILDTSKSRLEQLPESVNTKNSEFGHTVYNNQLIFSSLRADSISSAEEVYSKEYKTSIYTSDIDKNSFKDSEPLKALFVKKLNTGNGTFSLDGTRFYFSKCSEIGYHYLCKIMVAQYSNNKWTYIDSLSEIINEPGVNTTMPSIAEIDGDEVLFFSANREDSKGGLDIYYCTIKNGNQYGKVRSIKSINTIDSDITPWWDPIQKRLYFSSPWHNGFGGFDVHYSEFTTKWEEPINAGIPVNSPANDLYYFKYKDSAFVTSNRLGVLYSKNATCCSDIFIITPPEKEVTPTQEETLTELNKRLPVTLYFHNDIPDPRSIKPSTDVNYINSYNQYTAMIDKYKKEYAKGLSGIKADEAKEDIESFFIEYVDKGVSDLEFFRRLLLKELDHGVKINITVKGFASPLAKTDYNVNLTKRRISSLVNYMREYDNGVFEKYIDATAANGAKVVFSQVPFGEYTANQTTSDNPNDVQNSVYSRSAAKERKIEIQSVSYLASDTEFCLTTKTPVVDAGESKQGDIISKEIIIKNKSLERIEIDTYESDCDCLTAAITKSVIAPNETAKITLTLTTKSLTGFNVKSIILKVKNTKEEFKLYISTEIK